MEETVVQQAPQDEDQSELQHIFGFFHGSSSPASSSSGASSSSCFIQEGVSTGSLLLQNGVLWYANRPLDQGQQDKVRQTRRLSIILHLIRS